MNDLTTINWSPLRYSETAVIAQWAGKELLSRLDWFRLQPKRILDVGCGTGDFASQLQNRYSESTVFALDLSLAMLKKAKEQIANVICADGGKLPFAKKSVDLIFANFILPWHADFATLLSEWRDVLNEQGMIFFTALGPSTLQQIPEKTSIIPQLIDMHDIGDALIKNNFADPVLDVDHLVLSYRDLIQLHDELQATGMINTPFSLPASESWQMNFEIIFGHAFAGVVANPQEVAIPLAALRKQFVSK